MQTILAPITHAAPDDPEASIEIPAPVCHSLGLDRSRPWPRLDELKRFAWPGYDLRPIPGREATYHYGMLPPDLFDRLRRSILERQRAKLTRMVGRDE